MTPMGASKDKPMGEGEYGWVIYVLFSVGGVAAVALLVTLACVLKKCGKKAKKVARKKKEDTAVKKKYMNAL